MFPLTPLRSGNKLAERSRSQSACVAIVWRTGIRRFLQKKLPFLGVFRKSGLTRLEPLIFRSYDRGLHKNLDHSPFFNSMGYAALTHPTKSLVVSFLETSLPLETERNHFKIGVFTNELATLFRNYLVGDNYPNLTTMDKKAVETCIIISIWLIRFTWVMINRNRKAIGTFWEGTNCITHEWSKLQSTYG